MIAFLKRRWILVSCAVVLLACTTIDTYFETQYGFERYGLRKGLFFYEHDTFFSMSRSFIDAGVRTDFHPLQPASGLPRLPGRRFYYRSIDIPLWLPLAAILGWIVFRELRWREKRAKAADSSPTQ
jgi:hypothetical protein